jgi:hypothetical protein
LWLTVKEGSEDYTEDRMALEVITKAVPPEMICSIASKPTVKAAWDSITLCNIGVDRVWKAKVSSHKREFDTLTFHDGESVDDFGTRIRQITNKLVVLGYESKEVEVVRRFLLALPHKFEQIMVSIETLLDLESMMVDELIGHLKPTEECINHNGGNTVDSLNLIKDELVTRVSSRLKVLGNGGLGKGHGSGGHGGNHGGGDIGIHDSSSTEHSGSSNIAKDECHCCGKRGH